LLGVARQTLNVRVAGDAVLCGTRLLTHAVSRRRHVPKQALAQAKSNLKCDNFGRPLGKLDILEEFPKTGLDKTGQ